MPEGKCEINDFGFRARCGPKLTGNLHFYRKLIFLEISLLFRRWILLGGEGGAAMMLRLPHNFALQV